MRCGVSCGWLFLRFLRSESFINTFRKKVIGETMKTALEEFNERVQYVRSLMERMGLTFTSDKLEYEIARAVARRLRELADYDLRQILNEIYDNLDSTLSVAENVRIAESVIEKYVGREYDVESMYEAYKSWLASVAEEEKRKYEELAQREASIPVELLLGVDTGAGRKRRVRKSGKSRRERSEEKLEARLGDVARQLEELAVSLRNLETSLTSRLNELSASVEELKRMRTGGDMEFRDEVKAAFSLVMSTLKRLESRVERLEREVERSGAVVVRVKRDRSRAGELERYYARKSREKWWLI